MVSQLPHPESRQWLPTTEAAYQLGISPCTLKRYFKRDGILLEGVHVKRSPVSNQALRWNVNLCLDALHRASQKENLRR